MTTTITADGIPVVTVNDMYVPRDAIGRIASVVSSALRCMAGTSTDTADTAQPEASELLRAKALVAEHEPDAMATAYKARLIVQRLVLESVGSNEKARPILLKFGQDILNPDRLNELVADVNAARVKPSKYRPTGNPAEDARLQAAKGKQ